MIITQKKPLEEVMAMVGDAKTVAILGCGSCATACQTGGEAQVNELKAALEAAGKTVVATAVGGIPEMVQDGENGFLLSADPTAEEVAQAILRYTALSAQDKAAMSRCALASWQEHFDAAANAEKLMAFLAQL